MSPDQAAAYFRRVGARAAQAKPPADALPDTTAALATQVRVETAARGMRAVVTATTSPVHAHVTVLVPRGAGSQAQALLAMAAAAKQQALRESVAKAAHASATQILAP